MDTKTLQTMLTYPEGLKLEFKREINLKDKYQMADLLRHMLSLTNSPGETAYLIIGVENETRALVGTTASQGIAEESLQQLVRRYCTPPLQFQFHIVHLDGIPVGIIEIPPSDLKPHYLSEDIAGRFENNKEWKLERENVYTRRGSITDEATPLEIQRMYEEAKESRTSNRKRELDDPKIPISVAFFYHPSSRGFIGREKEQQKLEYELNRRAVVLVEGLAGIGKTFLVAQYLNAKKHLIDKPFWLECNKGTDLNHIFAAFLDFALRHDEKGMEAALQEDRPIMERTHALLSILESQSSFICLDGFEDAIDESIAPLIREFTDHCHNAKLVICSRERPKSFFSFLTDIGEVTLSGFELQDALELLTQLDVTNEDKVSLEQIARKTEGHPLALKLCAPLILHYGLSIQDLLNDTPELGKTLEEHWLSEIYTRLSDTERVLLERFSIFIEPVPRDAVGYIGQTMEWGGLLQELQDKFLISQVTKGFFSMHTLIRDFCRVQLAGKGLLQDVATSAANYHLSNYRLDEYNSEMTQDEVNDKLKAHHYLMLAGRFDLAAKVAHNIQHMLMKWARYSQLWDLCQQR